MFAITQPPNSLHHAISSLAQRAPHLGVPLQQTSAAHGLPGLKAHPLLGKWKEQGAWADECYDVRCQAFDGCTVDRLRSLRRLHCAPNAGLWLTAHPKPGEWERFSAQEWQALLAFRIGAPLYPPNSSCKACGNPMDPFGDHAVCCASSGLYWHHDRVRDALMQLTKKAGWNPELEVCIPNSRDRPADILLRSSESRPLAVDVTVTHPLRIQGPTAARGEVCLAADLAEKAKLAASAGACEQVGWAFRPFGVETTGGLGPSATRLVKQLQRHVSMRTGVSTSESATVVSLAISVSLAKGRGEMLVAAQPPLH